MPRIQWIQRFDTAVSAKPAKPGVWRRKDGGFVIRARVRDPRTGKDREIRRILPEASLDEAVARLAEEKRQVAEGNKPTEPAKIRLRDYAAALLDQKIRIGEIRSAATRAQWKCQLNLHIIPHLGDLFMSELRRSDLLQYHDQLATLSTLNKYSPRTCNSIMKILKVIVRSYARQHGLPEPASGIPGFDLSLRRTYTRQEPNSLRPPETEAFLAGIAKRYPDRLVMITLGFALGLRPSTLRALHKCDIIWEDGGWLLNRRSNTRGQEIMERTKIGKDSEIPLSPGLLEMLRQHLDGLPPGPMRDSPLLFPNKRGKVWSHFSLYRIFLALTSHLQISKKLTPRAMRRTSKDLLRLSGASQVVAMAINGHLTEEMHYHYSTVNECEIRDVLSRTTEIIGLDKLAAPAGGKTGATRRDPGPASAQQRRNTMAARARENYSQRVVKPQAKK